MKARPFDRQGFAHPHDRSLARRVKGGALPGRHKGRYRGYIDDPPMLPGLDEPRCNLAREEEGRTHVHVEHAIDEIERHARCELRIGNAGVVDEDPGWSESRLRLVDRLDDLPRVSDIGCDGGRSAARRLYLGDQRFEAFDTSAKR